MEKPRDVAGGALVMALGAGFLLLGRELPMGTSFRMGPGYFPTILGWILVALGGVLAGLALARGVAGAARAEHGWPWRAIALVIGSVAFFGITLRGIGLAPAILVVAFATAWASRYASVMASVSLALGLAAFCTFLFLRGLGLPLPMVGPWLDFGAPAPVETPADSPADDVPGADGAPATTPPLATPPASQ